MGNVDEIMARAQVGDLDIMVLLLFVIFPL
jgi:hypothetical protein